MNNLSSLQKLKSHSDNNSIPEGLIHISENMQLMDALLGKVGKYINEDFYVNSAQNTADKSSILHYDGENYTLDYTHYCYPHFAVLQTVKRQLQDRYSLFLYKPLFVKGVYALLIVDNNVLNEFVSKESFWFDQNFKRLQDGFDGFAELNAEQRTIQDTRPAFDASKAKKPNPEVAKSNGGEFYDLAYMEYKRNNSLNGFPVWLMIVLAFIILATGAFMYVTFSKADGSWASKSRSLSNTFSFLSPSVDKVDAATLQKYGGKLVDIPAGSFEMGKIDRYNKTCQPIHAVTVPAFKMMEAEVTFAQWDACVADGGCSIKPEDENWGRGQHPVINISYNDIVDEYIPWLYDKTGYHFQLPSEAQWEYAARAGSAIPVTLSCADANFGHHKNYRSEKAQCGEENQHTVPVKTYAPNAYGLYDMHGNVAEWVNDLHHDSYEGAPTDGSAWTPPSSGEVERKLHKDFQIPVRGGCFSGTPRKVQAASRSYLAAQKSSETIGFRLVLSTEKQ